MEEGRSLQHALVLQTFNEQYQGSPLYWPFPLEILETPAPLMILPLLIKIFNNGGGAVGVGTGKFISE